MAHKRGECDVRGDYADAGDAPISTYQANVPQLDVQVDRDKAKAQGVSLTDLFGTLQTYLGSSYVNDFNQFGRTLARDGPG